MIQVLAFPQFKPGIASPPRTEGNHLDREMVAERLYRETDHLTSVISHGGSLMIEPV